MKKPPSFFSTPIYTQQAKARNRHFYAEPKYLAIELVFGLACCVFLYFQFRHPLKETRPQKTSEVQSFEPNTLLSSVPSQPMPDWTSNSCRLPAILDLSPIVALSRDLLPMVEAEETYDSLSVPVERVRKDVYDRFDCEVCKQPAFAGGELAMSQFIQKNIHYPKDGCIQGTAVIQCIIEVDGSITVLQILREPTAGFGLEAIRIIELMPCWIPAEVGGEPVRFGLHIPVRFRLE